MSDLIEATEITRTLVQDFFAAHDGHTTPAATHQRAEAANALTRWMIAQALIHKTVLAQLSDGRMPRLVLVDGRSLGISHQAAE